jgi:indolepyruvate ferredoxin oxidoreductase, alpha subunit
LKTKLMTGNDAIAYGALHSGVKVVSGYPGTPSSEVIGGLLKMDPIGAHVEWSTNEKVAMEIAAAVAWTGQRALCTMKMSGLNVAYDSFASVAYSGCTGGLVVYVADDSGVSAGMCEQDSRGFAMMSDTPVLEPSTVEEAYELTKYAFELSEEIGSPVFLRLVTTTAQSWAGVKIDEDFKPLDREPVLIKDISKYTKAGAQICMDQHLDLINRLEKAGEHISENKINTLELSQKKGGVGIIACGVTASYLDEGYQVAEEYGFDRSAVSVLKVLGTMPFPKVEVEQLMNHCGSALIVLEELEPFTEKEVYILARKIGYKGEIIGKLSGHFSRIDVYTAEQVIKGLNTALNLNIPGDVIKSQTEAEKISAARPITNCAGCPHRGNFLAINQVIRKLKLKKDEVMVTGDIGCTILGMNPPFDTLWTELSMGASIGMAQGYYHSGLKTPVIATIGDSTFFHAGIPSLINAVQHNVPLTLIVMDNGWTSMTGMQVNPGTDESFQQQGNTKIDLAKIIPNLGVEHFFIVDPFKLDEHVEILEKAINLPGVKVILSRQECSIQALRRGVRVGEVKVTDKCTLCKRCVTITGCPAISLGEEAIVIDEVLCNGCGLCAQVCNLDVIETRCF